MSHGLPSTTPEALDTRRTSDENVVEVRLLEHPVTIYRGTGLAVEQRARNLVRRPRSRVSAGDRCDREALERAPQGLDVRDWRDILLGTTGDETRVAGGNRSRSSRAVGLAVFALARKFEDRFIQQTLLVLTEVGGSFLATASTDESEVSGPETILALGKPLLVTAQRTWRDVLWTASVCPAELDGLEPTVGLGKVTLRRRRNHLLTGTSDRFFGVVANRRDGPVLKECLDVVNRELDDSPVRILTLQDQLVFAAMEHPPRGIAPRQQHAGFERDLTGSNPVGRGGRRL